MTETFSVYGGAQSFLLGLMTLGFVFTLLTSGAVWMIGSDRILAVAAYDGAFPGFFGVFNRTFGTPVRVNMMSGIFATIFMVVAVASFHGGTDAKFVVVLDHRDLDDADLLPLGLPGGAQAALHARRTCAGPIASPAGCAACGSPPGLTTFWTALGSFVAVFPGTLESSSGSTTTSRTTWGVSRGTYEALTLGTLAVVLAIALIGYAMGRCVRERVAVIPLETDVIPPAPAAIT